MKEIIKNRKIMIGIFVLIAITLTVSFALYTYTRTSVTKTTITSGYIEFTYFENKDNVEISNAYPLADSIGAQDATNEYKFEVGLKTSSEAIKATYEVILLDNNRGESNYFNNEQIKIALIKNGTYVADTSDSKGIKLSEIEGFNEGNHRGEGVILSNQELTTGEKDEYKLRMWISSDVSYNNEIDENGYMEGKYNGYSYSLKVKINATGVMSIISETTFENLEISLEGQIDIDVSDKYGIEKYALTESTNTPKDNEWQDVEEVAKNKTGIEKVAKKKQKHLTIPTDKNGTYYLHVKNKIGNVSYKQIKVTVFPEIIEGESLIKIIEENELEDGYYTFGVKEEEYTAHVYVYDGNQTWNSSNVPIFGDRNDVASGTEEDKMAKNMVIVKVNGNLTIQSNTTVAPYYDSEYGGPKGFTIYVTGTLTNNGTIDNSHGAYARGQNVYLWKNGENNYEVVPAVGGAGEEATSESKATSGQNGIDKAKRATGGGGAGAAPYSSGRLSGAGGNGTSYSGGSGGGAAYGGTTGQAASNFGGAGGNSLTSSSSLGIPRGGTGNPGGKSYVKGTENTQYVGSNGTGGLLIIYCNICNNNGTISANGTNCEAYGGASGGGSINIFYTESASGNVQSVNGGTSSTMGSFKFKGGNGGAGTFTIMKIFYHYAQEVSYTNSKSKKGCNNVYCSLDELYEKMIGD